ncbi:MAG: [acyl-carrier-protein] S-malonyltransferase [Pseudomonadota bacterium]|jgi:[acyl-carrier-protein] S-malonyltransferase
MSFAVVFPGQGSQSLKMMDGFLECEVVQETFQIAKEVLQVDFLAMLQEATADNINSTINTQPLLLTAGVAIYNSWLHNGGIKPDIVAGHSLGEWSALVASGVVTFKDALKLVKIRASLMQQAVKPGEGSMVAVIGLDDEIIVNICNQVAQHTNGVVAAVNFNSPGQVVIAGGKDSVAVAMEQLKANGARKLVVLPMSVPSHCLLLKPASEKLHEALAKVTFNSPQIKVIHNFNVESYDNVDLIKEALVKQLYSPVLWTQTINKIVSNNIVKIVEFGPGKVLSGLNKRINETIVSGNLNAYDNIAMIKELVI